MGILKTAGHVTANLLHSAGATGAASSIRKAVDPASNGKARSNEWPRVRKEWLSKNPACAICGATTGKIEVHHKMPFSHDSSKELDPTNLITLCENNKWLSCHLCVGHISSFRSYNKNVEKDAAYIKEMLSHKLENEGK